MKFNLLFCFPIGNISSNVVTALITGATRRVCNVRKMADPDLTKESFQIVFCCIYVGLNSNIVEAKLHGFKTMKFVNFRFWKEDEQRAGRTSRLQSCHTMN